MACTSIRCGHLFDRRRVIQYVVKLGNSVTPAPRCTVNSTISGRIVTTPIIPVHTNYPSAGNLYRYSKLHRKNTFYHLFFLPLALGETHAIASRPT